jgi:hypothetical protein
MMVNGISYAVQNYGPQTDQMIFYRRRANLKILKDWMKDQLGVTVTCIKGVMDALEESLYERNDRFDTLIHYLRKEPSYIEWFNFIDRSGPYTYFVTLTFRLDIVKKSEAYGYLNKLLHFLNSRLYGREYYLKNEYIKGFNIIERQPFQRIHFHLLLKEDPALKLIDKHELEKILKTLSVKVKKRNMLHEYDRARKKDIDSSYGKYSVFSESEMRVDDVFDLGPLIMYVLKKMSWNNKDLVQALSVNGVV